MNSSTNHDLITIIIIPLSILSMPHLDPCSGTSDIFILTMNGNESTLSPGFGFFHMGPVIF